MSRHWSERNYIDADSLWSFIDEQSSRLDILSQNDDVESSELCKLLMLGRREMLELICQYLAEYQRTLGQVVTDSHGIFTREELIRLVKKDYGYE